MKKPKKLGPLSCEATTYFGARFYQVIKQGEIVATTQSAPHANLFRAAPDLLEFVQQIFNGIDTGMINIDTPADETLANVLSRGRTAISKATGAA